MNKKAKLLFYLQYFMGRLGIFVTAPLAFFALKTVRYRLRNLKNIRKTVKSLMVEHAGPWLICANHLTMIDSVILTYAMMPIRRYLFCYRMLPWNVPEKMNFNRNIFVGFACYLTKCISVIRGGDRDALKSAMSKCTFLMKKGENLMIFPEGTRSRTGRVNTENFSYGVGRLFCSIPKCRVMCIYLRGDGQNRYSNYPRYGETFTMMVEQYFPQTEFKGLRAQRDCAGQIVRHLSAMEKHYFASCGQ